MKFPIHLQLVSFILAISFAIFPCKAEDYAKPLNDYINEPAPHYQWEYTGRSFTTLNGAKAYVLNVTTIQWLNETEIEIVGQDHTIWTHEVIVLVPKNLVFTNVSAFYMSSFAVCNNEQPAGKWNIDLQIADLLIADTHNVGAISYQMPNCPIIYKNDPKQMQRSEDPLVAWSIRDYFYNPDHSPERLVIFPMAKAALYQMKAAEEFIHQNKFATLEDGWIVTGVSKRGWTSYLVGGATQDIVKVNAIAPMNPIVPTLLKELHHQYKSYGGFSIFFIDYVEAGVTDLINKDVMKLGSKLMDPLSFNDQLAKIPKMIITSSNDEFMMMEWSQYWYDEIKGEKHLLITPNAEHDLVTNLPGALSAVTTFIKSISSGHTSEQRPYFNYLYNNITGELTVEIPAPHRHRVQSVVLRYAQTFSEIRRDFRFLREENNHTEKCSWPWIKFPFGMTLKDANCVQPVLWHGRELKEQEIAPGTYSALPPKPTNDKNWIGYYIEVYFDADTKFDSLLFHNHFAFSTPGYVWPDTYPHADCDDVCDSIMV